LTAGGNSRKWLTAVVAAAADYAGDWEPQWAAAAAAGGGGGRQRQGAARDDIDGGETMQVWIFASFVFISLILLEGNLLKLGNPYWGPTKQPTIGHGGINAPLTICLKCGKTWPPSAADQSVAQLRHC
jgi:hypothetical protein